VLVWQRTRAFEVRRILQLLTGELRRQYWDDSHLCKGFLCVAHKRQGELWNYHERNRMSEDEIPNGDFQALDQGRAVQMEYVTDSGKDRLRICTKTSVRHSKGRQARGCGERGVGTDQRRWRRTTITDRLHALYGDGAEYIEVMDLTMELKSAYDPRSPT